MSQDYHPSVTVDFILERLRNNPKVIPESITKVGNTTYFFVVNGKKPVSRRTHIINVDSNNEVNFNQAMGLAINFGFISALMKWFEDNRSWKEGDYSNGNEID